MDQFIFSEQKNIYLLQVIIEQMIEDGKSNFVCETYGQIPEVI